MTSNVIESKKKPRTMGESSTLPRMLRPRILGNTFAYLRDPLGFLLRTARRGGEIVSLDLVGLDAYLLSDPEDIERVLITEHRKLKKDRFTRELSRLLGQGLLTSEGDYWRRQRRLAQPAFHRERIAAYARAMAEATEERLAGWKAGTVIDVHEEMMQLTRDIVCRTLFGTQAGPEMSAVNDALSVTMDRYAEPLYMLLPALEKMPLPLSRRYRRAAAALDDVVYGLIRKRRAEASDTGDLLSMLLSARDEDGSHMSDVQVRDEVMTIFLAGHETTAIALSWTFYLLSKNPEACGELGEEARRVLGLRTASIDDMQELRVTENVVSESMRLYPPAWALGREVVEPFEIRGHRFPKGAQIWLSQWVAHRDPRYFDEPEAFRPSRWEGGLAKRLPKFAYFPFGGGARLCIGNSFALVEATLVLAMIAARFRLVLEPGQRIEPFPSVTLRPKQGIRVRLEQRR